MRLFNETKDALDQQTAISEILRVISSSPTDVKPVLDAIAERAARLCDASVASMYLIDGPDLRLLASKGPTPDPVQNVEALPIDRGSLSGRAVLERKTIQVPDMLTESAEYPLSAEMAHRFGHRTVVVTPLYREGQPFGTILLRRKEVHPFSDQEMALLRTFGDQAAIALENVRLFNETKEALDQQRASGEVLAAISSSIADTTPVFDKILTSCERLFEGRLVQINLIGDDGLIHLGAHHSPARGRIEKMFPLPLDESSATGTAILRRSAVHYPDVDADDRVPPFARQGWQMMGIKAAIGAPMLWEGKGIGSILVGRDYPGPFSDKDIALLKTFADQAVIAIQNARLFREIQDKSRQLETANQHKSAFLANMSHELRTPLNAIIGFSEVLLERLFGEINEKQDDYLKDIHASGRHLLQLINDILDLSKVEAGRMELDLATFDVPDAIANAMTLIRERAQRHGIALSLDADPQLGEIVADERKFKQILLNLLSNAVKFTPDGGQIKVERPARRRRARRRRPRHGDRHRSRRPAGRVRGVPPGRTQLHEQAGRHRIGSRAHAQIRRAAWRPDLAGKRAGQRLDIHVHDSDNAMSLILIVEDNDKNLKLVRDVLQVKGYRTIEAGTAEEGIELAREQKPDLVLMDIQLPGMNGIEALKVLRADASTERIPVIAVTASVMQQDRNLITEAGFDGYIGKPINLREFIETVRVLSDARAPSRRHRAIAADTRSGEGVSSSTTPRTT